MAMPKDKMLSRDAKRRIEVIKKKLQDLQEMGVPCSFCYCTPWTRGLYIAGDQRIGREVKSITNRILRSLEEEEGKKEEEGDKAMAVFQLPRLKAPLRDLNQRALVSMLVGIAKDVRLRWDGERPKWWLGGIPFVHPREAPPQFKGKWVEALRALLQAAYRHFGYEDLLQVEEPSAHCQQNQNAEQKEGMKQTLQPHRVPVISASLSTTPKRHHQGITEPEKEKGQVMSVILPVMLPIKGPQRPPAPKRPRQEEPAAGQWYKRHKKDFCYYEYVPAGVRRPRRH